MKYLYFVDVLNLKAQALTKIGITPKEAAKLDPEAFMQFAEEVARVAAKLAETATPDPQAREPRQLRLEEGVSDDR